MPLLSEKIIGHVELRERLAHEYENEKLHHALLFTGQQGVGKRLVAMELALEILGRKNIEALNNCPDFHFYDPLLENSQQGESKEIRKLLATLALRPFEGKGRVTVIDNAHALGRTTANTLLKTLEEPKENSFFILITHNKERLLPTVVSRCRVWSFLPLRPEEIKRILEVHGRGEDIQEHILKAGNFVELELLAQHSEAATTLSSVFVELERGAIAPWYRFLRAHNNLRDREFARFCFRFLQLKARETLRKVPDERTALFLENLIFLEHFVLERNLSAQLCLTTALKAYAEHVPLSAHHLEEQLVA